MILSKKKLAEYNLMMKKNYKCFFVKCEILAKRITWLLIISSKYVTIAVTRINMRIIAKKNLTEFIKKHPKSKIYIEAWHSEAKEAKWKTPADVTKQFPKASIIGEDRVVFRKGNTFRIVAKINYAIGIIYICFLGTHAEYDKIDPKTVWNY